MTTRDGPPLTLGNNGLMITSASSLGGGGSSSMPLRSNSLTVPYQIGSSSFSTTKSKNGNGSNVPSDSISVSSKSSTGSRFLERMRNTSSGVMRGTGRVVNNILPSTTNTSSSSNNNHKNVPLSSSTAEIIMGSGSGGTTRILSSHSQHHHEDDNLLLHADENYSITTNKQHLRTNRLLALTWGKKNAVTLSLDKFVCVKKGKCTDRTLRNSSPSSRLLSIITNVRENESLDIEAPTMLDRDKFASAFAKFLGVPLLEEEEGNNNCISRSGGGGGGIGSDAVVVDGGGVVDGSSSTSRAGGRTSVASAGEFDGNKQKCCILDS